MSRDRFTFSRASQDSDAERKTNVLKRFIDQLPIVEREALTRFYVREQSSVQIQRELGIAPEQLRELKTRARMAFRERAAPNYTLPALQKQSPIPMERLRRYPMNPSGIETLTNPHPRGHIVYAYNHEEQLTEAICLYAIAGLHNGETVVLIMTPTHKQAVRLILQGEINLHQLEAAGQLICVDAQHLLDRFMFDGMIDEQKFKTEIGGFIGQAKAINDNGPVRVFGELVDLIWISNPKATQRLEELWNEVIEIHRVPLLCGYSLSSSRPTLSPALMACHSHAVA